MYLGYQKGKIKYYTGNEIPKELYNLDKVEYTDKEYVYDTDVLEYVLKDDAYIEKELNKAKEAKKTEASQKAYEYIANGAMYEFEESKHIEANDGNISKLGLAAVELVIKQDMESTIEWCTVEDEVVHLNAIQLQEIVQGLKAEQSRVWVELYPEFLEQIEDAQTIDKVNAIVIDYKKLNFLKKNKK